MTDGSQYDDFFDGVGGGGAPGFKFSGINSGIKGTITDLFKTVVTDPKGVKKLYPDGKEIPQLNVTLQTDLRNWDGIAKPPVDPETGQPKPASEDDGLRRIFVKYDMRRAVAVAVRGAEQTGLRVGGELAVKQTGEKDTGNANPLPLYEARYKPPAAGAQTDGFFEGAAPAAAPAPPAGAGGWSDEPPF